MTKPKPPTILIIEDEADLQQAYVMILTTQGYTIATANNGIDGLQRIKTVQPDLILLDIFMPQMDGREVLRNLDLDLYPNMKVIVYSNLSDRDMESEMAALGAHRVMLKSKTNPSELIALVKEVLSS